MGKKRSNFGSWLPLGSLVVLAVQNSALTLLMRHSRLQPGPPYSPASVVCWVEALKLLLCLALEEFTRPASPHSLPRHWWLDVQAHPSDWWKLAVPACLYALQNNLGYVALTMLPALTYQVLYQMKILTTALFTVLLLRRRLSFTRWISLLVLMTGVILVQMARVTAQGESSKGAWLGFAILLLNSITSGFAGVYFELTCKQAKRSLWLQSIHLGLWGLGASLVGAVLAPDGNGLSLVGYTQWTYAVIAMQALSGLLVALVIR